MPPVCKFQYCGGQDERATRSRVVISRYLNFIPEVVRKPAKCWQPEKRTGKKAQGSDAQGIASKNMSSLMRDDRLQLQRRQVLMESRSDIYSRPYQTDSERWVGKPIDAVQTGRIETGSDRSEPELVSFCNRAGLERTQRNIDGMPASPPVEGRVSESGSESDVKCAMNGTQQNVERHDTKRPDVVHATESIGERP